MLDNVIKVVDFRAARDWFRTVDSAEVLSWVEWVFRHKDEFQMPPKTRISQPDGDYYACMPCMHAGLDLAIVKMVGRHVGANVQLGLPAMTSDILCYKASTGKLLGLLDGEYLTTLRSGACAAFSALLYARSNFQTIGLIGLGNIMSAFLDVLVPALDGRRVVVNLYKHKGQELRFVERYASHENIEFRLCDGYSDVIEGADLIVSAVTRAERDFCDVASYKKGCTVIPVMTLGFQNCDREFDMIFTDEIEQIKGFKFFDQFRYVANTDDVLASRRSGRLTEDDRVLVYNYGLASLDLMFASRILEDLSDVRHTELRYCACNERYFI